MTSKTEAQVGRPWGVWATLGWGAGGAVVAVAAELLGFGAFMAWQSAAHPEWRSALENFQTNGPLLAVVTLVSTPLIVGFLIYAARRSRMTASDYLALHWPAPKELAIGVAALAIVIVLSDASAALSGRDVVPAFMTETYRSALEAGFLPLLVIAFVVGAPLQEEIAFRGFFYRGFAARLGVPIAIVVTSAFWAALHVQYEWFFIGQIFFIGLVLGWLRWRSGSTVLTMALHAISNAIALTETAIYLS